MHGKPRAWEWLIRQVPPNETEWRARQTRLGLNTALQYQYVVRGLVDEPCSTPPSTSSIDDKASLDSLTALARRFSQSTQRSSAGAALHRAVAAFKRLILLSLCLVLRDQGLTAEAIDQTIVWFSPLQRVRENCLKGIVWVHDAIRTLHSNYGWTESQATELFFLVPLSVSRLGEIHSIDVNEFAQHMPAWPGQSSLSPNFTLASLVWRLCQQCQDSSITPSFESIRRILGSRNSAQPLDDDPFKVFAPARKLEVELCYLKDVSYKLDTISPTLSKGTETPKSSKIRRIECADPADDSTIPQTCQAYLNAADSTFPAGTGDQRSSPLLSLFRTPTGAVSLSHHQLQRGLSPQRRWDKDGNVAHIHLPDLAVSPGLKEPFKSEERLESELHNCTQQGWLTQYPSKSGLVVYSIDTGTVAEDWLRAFSWDGLAYLCHIFPREEALDSSFQLEGKNLVPQLQMWFRYLRDSPGVSPPIEIREQLIEVCVGVSKIQSPVGVPIFSPVLDCLSIDGIPQHLRLDLVRAQSAFLRSLGVESAAKSNKIIESALQQSEQALKLPDRRVRSSIQNLWFSLIENAVLQQDFEKALSVVNRLELPEDQEAWPELDFQLARQTLTLRGLLFRGLGRFEQAAEVLETCSTICESYGNGGTHRYHLIRHRAELFCELGRPERALAILEDPLNEISQNDMLEDSRAHRRLCLANAEAAGLAKQRDLAEMSLDQVETFFEMKPPEMPVDQLDHVRVFLVRMRFARDAGGLVVALSHVSKALQLLEMYHFVKARQYFTNLALKFRVSIYLELARADEQKLAGRTGQESQHLVVGMGSYGRDAIIDWYDEAKSAWPAV